jgi:phenylalanine-4-hydroxylase
MDAMRRADTHPPDMRADYTIDQHWELYTPEEHARWRELFARQSKLLAGRACEEFLEGMHRLGIVEEGIPDFRRVNDILGPATGWQLVAVPGLIPDDVFFTHLSKRQFPVTNWIREPHEMDYLQEPDVFHDLFGHVPLLIHPVFADYMEAFGHGGVKALKADALPFLSRLYWYTVEFGLINTPNGLRIYGAGIVSSKGESIYCLDSQAPHRIGFDELRIMQTAYKIDDYQATYFVIDSYDQLFEASKPDFLPYYEQLRPRPTLDPHNVLPTDKLF